MGLRSSSCQTEYCSPRIWVPMRSTKPCECRDNNASATISHSGSHFIEIAGSLYNFKLVPEPLKERPRNEDRTLQRVSHLRANTPPYRGKKTVFRTDCLPTSIHEKEASRSVSALSHPRVKARLTEKSGLLITGHSPDRYASPLAYYTTGVDYLRKNCPRNPEHLKKSFVPLKGMNIEQARSGGIGDIRYVDSPTGQLPDNP